MKRSSYPRLIYNVLFLPVLLEFVMSQAACLDNLFLFTGCWKLVILQIFPAGKYMFKVNNRNTRTRGEICSKITVKTIRTTSGVFVVNFEHISHLVLVFRLLTLNMLLLGDTLLQSMSFGNRTNLGAK